MKLRVQYMAQLRTAVGCAEEEVDLPDGSTEWKRSPGGLVTALEPLLRRRHGAWIGWPGIADADEEPLEQDDMRLCPVRLSADDIENY